MPCRLLGFCFAAAILGLALAAPASSAELLRWKFSPGDRWLVELSQKSEIETTVANKPVVMKLDMGMEINWLVQAVDERGTARIEQSISRLRLKLELTKVEPVEFDTAGRLPPKGPAKDVADALLPLLDARYQISLNSRGEIEEVKLTGEPAKLLDSPYSARFKEMFSKEGLADLLGQAVAVLPEQEVAPGDTWKRAAASKSPLGPLKFEHQYSYLGSEQRGDQKLEKISVETTLELAEPQGKPQLKEQKHSGTLYFDALAGRFVETEARQELATEAPYRDTAVKTKAVSSLRMKLSPSPIAAP